MKTPLRFLLVEDNPNDAELVLYELKKQGYTPVFHTVQTKEEFLGHLSPDLDIVLADYVLPDFTGADALILLKERYPDIPLIIITGVLGDEVAAEIIKLGAADFLLKDRLARLGEAVKNALRQRDLKLREREQARALKESEERYRLIFENSMDAILLTSPDGTIQAATPAACAMFGHTEDEIVREGRALIVDETDPRLSAALEERARTGRFKGDLTLLRNDGTRFPGELSSSVYTDRDGMKRTSMIIRDMTEHHMADELMRRAVDRFRTVMDGIDAIIYVADMETYRILFINKYGQDHIGAVEGNICWQAIQKDQPGPCPFCTNERLVDATGKSTGIYCWEFKNTITRRWYDCRDIAIRWLDGHLVRLEIATDITERKNIEEQLKHFNEELELAVNERTNQLNKSLDEKEVLLKEVHHRVKNNMQIINSLLNLQSRTIDDPVVLKTIKESQSRIRAMALVHERLYRSSDISTIDLGDYIQSLIQELSKFYGVKSQHIRFTIHAPVVRTDINTAIPLGLIVNELISNAIKYAFPQGKKGEITIEITKHDNNISLVVRDNGIGIPGDLDWRNTNSLGLRLVSSLVGQLQGTIDLDRSAGTAYAIVVKEKG